MHTSTNHYWVAKFGGTSLATYTDISRCIKLIANHPNVRVIVVSAPAGVTNLLVKLCQSNLHEVKLLPTLNEVKIKIHSILRSLNKEPDTAHLRQEVLQIIQDMDRLAMTL